MGWGSGVANLVACFSSLSTAFSPCVSLRCLVWSTARLFFVGASQPRAFVEVAGWLLIVGGPRPVAPPGLPYCPASGSATVVATAPPAGLYRSAILSPSLRLMNSFFLGGGGGGGHAGAPGPLFPPCPPKGCFFWGKKGHIKGWRQRGRDFPF